MHKQAGCSDSIYLDEHIEDLADYIAIQLLDLTPSIDDRADCFDIACEASAFFAQAGIDCELYGGSFTTSELGLDVVLVPHYWLEVPCGERRLRVDLTLPYWLTPPGRRMTEYERYPTVVTVSRSARLGRRYYGEPQSLPEGVGTSESSALRLYPGCTFPAWLVDWHARLSRGDISLKGVV